MKLAELYTDIVVRDTEFRGAMARDRKLAQVTEQAIAKVGRAAKYMFAGAAAGAALSVREFGNFEQGMVRVKALTKATEEQYSSMSETARLLGRTTVYSAREAADAMGFFALAGFKSNEIMAAMPATLNLAAAGQMDVASAADIASKIMRGMGLTAAELTNATDILTRAFTTSNTDLQQLGEAMKYVGPVGRSAGKGLEELTAAIQVMSNAGIQGAMAGTSLRMILSKLSGSSKESSKIFETLGINVSDAGGKLRPLAEIIDDLNASMAGMGETERLGLMMQAFGARAGGGIAALLSEGGDALRNYQKSLEGAGGAAKQIADVQMDSLWGSFKKLSSAASGLAESIGAVLSPAVRVLADMLTKAINWATDLNNELGGIPAILAAVAGAAAGVVAVLAPMVVSLGLVTAGWGALVAAAGMFITPAIAGAIATVVVGLGSLASAIGVVVAAYGVFKASEWFFDAIGATDKLADGFLRVAQAIGLANKEMDYAQALQKLNYNAVTQEGTNAYKAKEAGMSLDDYLAKQKAERPGFIGPAAPDRAELDAAIKEQQELADIAAEGAQNEYQINEQWRSVEERSLAESLRTKIMTLDEYIAERRAILARSAKEESDVLNTAYDAANLGGDEKKMAEIAAARKMLEAQQALKKLSLEQDITRERERQADITRREAQEAKDAARQKLMDALTAKRKKEEADVKTAREGVASAQENLRAAQADVKGGGFTGFIERFRSMQVSLLGNKENKQVEIAQKQVDLAKEQLKVEQQQLEALKDSGAALVGE